MFAKKIKQLQSALRKIQSGDRASIKSVYETLEQLDIRFEENNWVLGPLNVAETVSITRVLQSILNEDVSRRDGNRIGKLVKLLNNQNVAERTTQHIRVFISSPSDVSNERSLAFEVLEQLAYDPLLRGRISVEVVAWDKPGSGTPLLATMTPQEAIDKGLPKPSECDIVITIFWARLGTPLGKEYVKPKPYRFPTHSKLSDGRYFSGTEWEMVDALQASAKSGKPFVIVYRKMEEPQIGLKDPKFDEKIEQYQLIEDFFGAFTEADKVIRRGYNQFQTPSDFRKQLEIHLRDLVSQLLAQQEHQQTAKVEDGASQPLPQLWKDSPFPGLRAFGLNDAPIYFGRGNDIDGLIEKIKTSNFIAIVSASGAGKSSLVGAGLLPRLQKNAVEGSRSWPILQFSPDQLGAGDVFASLAASLQQQPFKIQKPKLANFLREHPEELLNLLRQQLNQPWAKVILFIDQFEEIFTRVKADDQRKFIEAISQLVNVEVAKVIVTVRADFYSRCLEIPELETLIKKGTYPVYAPKRDELREMIERPAEQAGLSFEPGLVRRILDDTGDQPGSLALMAFALQQLYENRGPNGELQHRAYEGFGGVSGAIGKQAQKAFDSIPHEAQKSLPKVFRDLIEVSDAGIPTRARVELDKVAVDQSTEILINELVQQRLLVVNTGPNNKAIVEVAHEALFRSWSRLATWISEIGEDLAFGNRITREAREWTDSQKDTSFLLRGTRLEQASAWLKRAELNLIASDDQRKFIIESEKQEQRIKFAEVHRKRRIATTLAYTLTTIGLVLFGSWLIIGGYGQLFTKTEPLSYPVASTEDYLKALFGVNTNQAWAPIIEEFDGIPMALVPTGCFYQGYSQPLLEAAKEICQQDKEFDKNKCSNLGFNTGPEQMTCFDKPFWLDVYEVSNAQYGSSSLYQGENRPRDTIDFYEADSYCKSRDALLPTESQWEYAGRGPSSLAFPWGNSFDQSFTNWDQNSTPISSLGDRFQLDALKKLMKQEDSEQDFNIFSQSWSIGSNPNDVSWVGAFDMAGNVTEWVTVQDPNTWIMKGGSYWSDSFTTILAYKKSERPGRYLPNLGFRCARSFEFPSDAMSTLLQNSPMLEPNQTIKGNIGSNPSLDLWKFNTGSNSTATLEIQSDQNDLSVLLMNSEGEIIARYRQKQGTLYLVDIPSGDYLIYANGDQAAQFSIELDILDQSDRPSSFAGNAQIISFDKTSNFANEWTFTGKPGDLISIDIKSNMFDLIDPNGVLLKNDVTSNTGLLHLTESGIYTLKIINTAEYTLLVETVQPTIDKRIELNKDLMGSLTLDNYKDYWLFNGSAGDTIAFLLDTTDFYSTMRFYNLAGEILSQNNSTIHKPSSIVSRIPDTGIYVLEVGQREQVGGNYRVVAKRMQTTPDNRAEIGKQISASLEEGNPNTFWYFDGNAGDTISVRMESNDFKPGLYLYDSAGQLLEGYVNSTAGSDILQMKLPDSDQYFIQASRLNHATGDYTLLIETTDPYGKNQLTVGESISDVLEGQSDQNYWYFRGFIGDIISISMQSSDFEAYLSLYGPRNDLLSSTEDGDAGRTTTITYQLQSSGLYTIKTGTKATGGRYELSVAILDPDSEKQLAFGIPVTDSLGLDAGNGTDYWFFDAQAGEIASIKIDSNKFHPLLSLYNPRNELIYSTIKPTYTVLPQSNTIPSYMESLQIPLSISGKYRMEVQGLEKIYTPYTYSLVFDKTTVDDGLELGTSVTEDFTAEHPDKLWFIEAQANELIFIQTESKNIIPKIQIYSSDGELLKESISISSGVTINSDFIPLTLPQNGKYVIRASQFSSSLIGDSTSQFTLHIKLPKTSKNNLISMGTRMTRSLDATKPQEYLFFEAQEGEVVSINAQSATFTPSITLYDSKGASINFTLSSPVLILKSDTYIVKVGSSSGPAGNYTLSIDKANQTLFGKANTDELGTDNLQDIWYFEAQAGDFISINPKSEAFTPSITLYDSRGQSISAMINFPILLARTDTYTVRVGSQQLNSFSSYTLKIDKLEANESNQISLGESVTDKLDTSNLQDIWYFKAQAGDFISINAKSEASTPPITLSDSKGQTLPLLPNYPIQILRSDTYSVRVGSPSGPVGGYTLDVGLFEPTLDNRVSLGESITDELSTGNLQDIWYFKAQAGDFISINAKSEAFTPLITMYDSRGQTISAPINFPILISQSDTYSVRVGSQPGSVGGYILRIEDMKTNESNQLSLGETVTNKLDTSNPQDIWYFEAQAGDFISINAKSEVFTPFISIYDSRGQPISVPINLPFLILQSDTYSVRVGSQSGSVGSYIFSVEDLGPNESNQLSLGEAMTDKLDTSNPQDIWYFEAKAGDFISINAKSEVFTPFISIYDSRGQTIYAPINLPFLISQSDTYSVRVGSQSGPVGVYTLAIDVLETTRSNQISLGESVNSSLSMNRLWDLWLFKGQAGDRIVIELNSREIANPQIILYGPDNQRIGFSYLISNESAIHYLTVPKTGSYTIMTGGTAGLFDDNSYTMKIIQLFPEESNQIPLERDIVGTSGIDNPQDYWFIEAQAGDLISIKFDRDVPYTMLKLFDSSGQILSSSTGQINPVTTGQPYTINEEVTFTVVPKTDQYALLVSSANKTMGSYTLNADRVIPNRIIGQNATGALGLEHPRDFWSLEGQAGDTVSIVMDAYGPAPSITVWDPEGKGLIYRYTISGLKYIYQLDIKKSGRHIIQVANFSSQVSKYQLVLEQIEE